jgi:hypothetical protein
MKGMGRGRRQCTPARDLYRILSTSITIYDSAMTLLGGPPPEGVTMPGPAHMACVKNIVDCLAVNEDDGLLFS